VGDSSVPKRLTIYTDGGSRGNPGPAAIGVVIINADGDVVYEFGATIGTATNNVAEYRALIRGLEQAAQLGADVVQVRMDSELLVRQMSGVYRIKNPKLMPLAIKARSLINSFDRCDLQHIPRKQNAHADKLANQAMDESQSE